MEQKTHLKINPELWGTPTEIKEGFASVKLTVSKDMAADEYGLVHGGTVFGLADYAAMLAVNHPNVVLAKADVKFLKPVQTGETLLARAKTEKIEGKKIIVVVDVVNNTGEVFAGEFLCIIPDKHVLSK
ncbi:PaaI family thioesterase [Desulfonauticus submarinus]